MSLFSVNIHFPVYNTSKFETKTTNLFVLLIFLVNGLFLCSCMLKEDFVKSLNLLEKQYVFE